MTDQTNRRIGFTLVELLVVIAIIGILVALLLPAVQAAREAARRMQCSNNFKQAALAMHNYHTANQTLPMGMAFHSDSATCPGFPSGFYYGWGWHVALLPYIEQQNIYDEIDFTSGGSHLPGGREAMGYVIEMYICPSDSNGDRWTECCSSYNIGPNPTDDVRVTCMAGVADSHDHYCAAYRAGKTDANGVLFNLSSVRIDDIRDGTSNTLLIGEVTGGMGSHPSQGTTYLGYTWQNWAVQDTAQGINGPGSIPGGRDDSVDPIDGDGGNRHDELYDEVGFSSYHPGGAFFAFGDGSVHFISENINQVTLESLATRAGGEIVSAGDY